MGEQRRLAEELDQKVAQRTRELDRFFTISLDLLCIADRHGYFLRLNQAWENTLGYALSELMERPFMEFVHPEDVTKTRAAYADLTAGRDVLNFINRYRGKDGTYRWLEWSAASGPSGAASKLGVPSSTLESKIRALKINNHRF